MPQRIDHIQMVTDLQFGQTTCAIAYNLDK